MGSLCVEGSSAPVPCPGGTHANQTVLNISRFLSSRDQCLTCPVGTYCPVGTSEPAPCAAGTFSDLPEQQSCLKCSAGTFQANEGATACEASWHRPEPSIP